MKFQEDKLEIIPYTDAYKEDLIRLTREWIEKDFYLEPEDVKFIENPTEYVIEKGGFIFLAKYDNQIVGTVSLCKIDNSKYELAKLAVTEKYKGLKLGKRLMEVVIEKCKEIGAKELILVTAKKLVAAYNLYLKYGFVEIEVEKQKYVEADTTMKLKLGGS